MSTSENWKCHMFDFQLIPLDHITIGISTYLRHDQAEWIRSCYHMLLFQITFILWTYVNRICNQTLVGPTILGPYAQNKLDQVWLQTWSKWRLVLPKGTFSLFFLSFYNKNTQIILRSVIETKNMMHSFAHGRCFKTCWQWWINVKRFHLEGLTAT